MVFDGATTDPVQMAVRDSLIALMSATEQAQAEAAKDAQRAGIVHAKAKEAEEYRGRKPTFTADTLAQVRDMLGQGANSSAISKATGLSRQTVYLIKDHPAEAEAALATWAA